MTMTHAPRERGPAAYPVRADQVSPGEFSWRLTTSNGRSVARSARTFPSSDLALDALDELIVLAARLDLAASIGHRSGGGWGWTMLDAGGAPTAHSPRSFERRGSCARSLERFRRALADLRAT